jgi:phenylalanyl-tRNA synthetase beta chain
VVVALPGAVLPGGFEIAARTTYDHVSDGMICSVRELGSATTTPASWCWRRRDDVPAAGHARRCARRARRTSSSSSAVTPTAATACPCAGIAREMGTGLAAPWRDPGGVTPPAWSASPRGRSRRRPRRAATASR